MIANVAAKTALFFADKNVYKHDEVDVYKYGFELLISTVVNCFGIMLISGIMGVVFDAVLFMAAFVPLRLTAGGYHAKHHWSCILIFNTIFFAFCILLKYISVDIMLFYCLSAVVVSSILIWILSPIEAVNKPLIESKKVMLRRKSIFIAFLNMVIVTILYFIKELPISLFSFYFSGVLAASFSLVAAVALKKTETPSCFH